MADETNLDVKEAPPQPDAMDDSSTPTEVFVRDANAGKSMQDFVREQMTNKGQPPKPESEAEPETVTSGEEEGNVQPLNKTAPEGEETTAEKGSEAEEEGAQPKEGTEPEAEVTENEPVPYDRFKEVNERAKSAEAEVRQNADEVRSYRTITDFCRNNGIAPQQFQQALEVVAAINNGDIEKAAPQIRQWYDQIQDATGDRLPRDIQDQVDKGLDLEVARAWAKDRAKANLVEGKGRRTIEQIQADQQAEFDRQIGQASNTWLAAKMKLDPDFKKGTMKYDEVEDRYQNLINQKDARGQFVNPVRNVQDLLTLMDKAYNDVIGRYRIRNGNKPLTRKLLPGNGASGSGQKQRFEDAPNMQEAVRRGMKERGHSFS